MEAAILNKIETPLVIEDIPTPTPLKNEVLIKIKACGECHYLNYTTTCNSIKYYRCKKFKTNDYITNTTIIPNYCPLEDK